MNKSDLIDSVAGQTGVSRHMLEVVLNRVFRDIESALSQGNTVSIQGFGKFSVKSRAARQGRNPRTGEPLQIPASKTVSFKPAKTLKDGLQG